MKKKLIDIINIKRRYTRSVNLDRDLKSAISLYGYILTPKNADIICRILESLKNPIQPKFWTITGLYGTGKSAFAEFLIGLLTPTGSPMNKTALSITREYGFIKKSIYSSFRKKIGKRGLVIAVTVAQREPLKKVILKGLQKGVSNFWTNTRGAKPGVILDLEKVLKSINNNSDVPDEVILDIIQRIAIASKSGLIILIDELGKILEFSSNNTNHKDLFLLQQIAEMPVTKNGALISLVGILHQSFSDYSRNLNQTDKNEWVKIQGRFEDIAFSEAHDYTMRLLSNVIENIGPNSIMKMINNRSKEWSNRLGKIISAKNTNSELIKCAFPLHPLSLIALPLLCEKFAQNKRSMFSFMTSMEPYSFVRFLENNVIDQDNLPLLKLHNLYDYFIESSGFVSIQDKVFQRWVEIQNYLSDFQEMGKDVQALIKTIGILNLLSHSGELSAKKELVILSLCDSPVDKKELSKWEGIIDDLINRRLLNYRTYGDEIRLWEGSDFDINSAIKEHKSSIKGSLETFLNEYFPLDPMIAHRHSYETGTLRYFERKYIGDDILFTEDPLNDSYADGYVLYYVGREKIDRISDNNSIDNRPMIKLKVNTIDSLERACHDFIALKKVEKKSPELKTDGVARKEIRQRLLIAKKVIETALRNSITPSYSEIKYYQGDRSGILRQTSELSELLSNLCDEYYCKGAKLWNEMINRGHLTAQIAKARRELIEAMLNNEGEPDLNIKGYGPEKAIFDSVLLSNKIYCFKKDRWKFGCPSKKSGLYEVWNAIEGMCKKATDQPNSIIEIYNLLKKPPYGVREGVLPILLLAILLKNPNSMSLYFNGSFIPVVGPEHFELLVKRPEHFSIKYFQLKGLRLELFRNLSDLFQVSESHEQSGLRNETLLGIIKPLIKFIKSLPKFTLQTANLNDRACKVREVLLNAKEPDKLLFEELPLACGLIPISPRSTATNDLVKKFRSVLIQSLRTLNTSYDELLNRCKQVLARSFSVDSEIKILREHLRVRASYLIGSCIEPRMRGFLKSAIENSNDDRAWLESVIMIIADKPAYSWTDDDESLFEANANDFARRFINLEALYKELESIPGRGFEARRVVVTKPDGTEENRILWTDKSKLKQVKNLVEKLISKYDLDNNTHEFQSLIAGLLERYLFNPEEESETEERKTAINEL